MSVCDFVCVHKDLYMIKYILIVLWNSSFNGYLRSCEYKQEYMHSTVNKGRTNKCIVQTNWLLYSRYPVMFYDSDLRCIGIEIIY